MDNPPEIKEARSITGAQAALAAGGVLLLLLVLWFAFLRGGDEAPGADVVAPPVTAPVVPVEPVDPGGRGKDGDGPVETFEVFAPKDPFAPLIDQSPADPGTTDGGIPPTDTDGDGVIDDGSGTGDGTGKGTSNGGGGENIGGHRVTLVDVFGEDGRSRAQIQVDGTVYTVDEGDQFAESFELLSLSGDCATLLFGDDQFTLCEGEEILK